MKIINILFWLALLAPQSSFGFSQSSVVDADIVVAADSSGDFTTLQAAIDASPSNSDRRTVIYIKRGLYNNEKLIVPADKINITLLGESRDETIISYHIYDCDGGKCPADDAALWTGDNILTSATLTILGDGFRAENLTIQNTAGPVGQAQAITVRTDKCVFINVDLYGYQDTMYFWSEGKRSYFENCLVVGRTDYIYGSGTVFFQSCEIRSWGGGWITAPSTALEQPYGFVFNECELTYALNSPRGGDDGELVRFGRPWHNYPKVAWLNCEMTEKIHPEGWGDTWRMDYADTSDNLHLYEYNNTGPGADTSGRADWAGIKVLTDEEALEYTVQKVMAGDDGWDPSAEAPLVQNYKWIGASENNSWLASQNWNPEGTPANGELALVDSIYTIVADGDTFPADLVLKNNAVLNITSNSVATYISVSSSEISTLNEVSLSGKVATKDSIGFNIEGILILDAELTGVHHLTKKGSGKLVLNGDNSNFSGDIEIVDGTLGAAVESSLGKSSLNLGSGTTLTIGNANAVYAKSKLEVVSGSTLQLNDDVTISEFYIDSVLQNVGEYTATSNPELISDTGKIIIGRPDTFIFHRGENGNWDIPEHYTPALLPQTGETVICEEEMETTSTVFEADIVVQNAGSIRLRGSAGNNHTCTGTIYMEEGTSFRYNTGGSGMFINAPVVVNGDVIMNMESGDAAGSTMTLAGDISGSAKITALNNGKGTINHGKLLLTGNNSDFDGTWDLTQYSTKYPSTEGYISMIEGKSENAFGNGEIIASHQNKVIFNHLKAAGDSLNLTLNESAKALLNENLVIKDFVLNGTQLDSGIYSATTHPDYFEGAGKIYFGEVVEEPVPNDELPAFPGAEGHAKYITGGRGGQVIFVTTLQDNNNPGSLRYAINQSGARIVIFKVSGTIQLLSNLNITQDNITIAGQTAPGDGITIRDYPVYVDADNVIIRFMRFRMGDAAAQEADALGGRFHKNIIIDHCSMSWSTDECVSFYQNEDFTLQWCIVSESLRNSVHEKGTHGYGGIWGGKNASFHHNLLAHHDSRNPRFGEVKGDVFALTDLVDLRNNVVYNWQGNSAYGGEAMNANIVNCYYKPGPATTKIERIISIDKLLDEGYPITNTWGKFYIDGNVLTASDRATNDNWTYGVYNQFNSKYTLTETEKENMRLSEPLNPGEVTTHTAEMAYEKILSYCGASLVRDTIDNRIIYDVANGTATYIDGGNGSINGIIDTQDAVGGWPALETLAAPLDSDEDGMPDVWETNNGLSSSDPNDAQLTTVDGEYPNIEVYINSLVSDIISEQNKMLSTTTKEIQASSNNTLNLHFNNQTNELQIIHETELNEISIFNLSGMLVQKKTLQSSVVNWIIPSIRNGIYIVRVEDKNNRVFSRKISVFGNR